MSVTMKFKVGDKVRVTGDKKGFAHAFEPGMVGTIKTVDTKDVSYAVHGTDTYGDTDAWWVHEDDLESPYVTLNEQALRGALKIVGVPDTQHDQIVTAYNTITEILA